MTRWHRISDELIITLQAPRCLSVLDLWDCPMGRLPDLRCCSSLSELKLSDVDVLLNSDDTALLQEYGDILRASNDDLALPESLEEVSIRDCRNTVVKEICWKLQGLKNVIVLSMQRVRVSWDWELHRSSTKAFSPSLRMDNRQCKLENQRGQLHQKIGIDQPEQGTDGEWAEESASDGEQSCSDDEYWDEARSAEVSSFPQQRSVEMPGEVRSFKQVARDEKGEKHSAFIKMLSNVIYWIQESLGDESIQFQVKEIINNGWQKNSPVLMLPHLGEYRDIWASCERLLICEEMRKVHYKSPDYVLLEAFDNFDTMQILY
ncbi:hypothetical protein L7F22_004849 [Adiantum nelumboides]|nr:hypothetical protein [Adiantum nelumboides]